MLGRLRRAGLALSAQYRAAREFTDYKPGPGVSRLTLKIWLEQFDPGDRAALVELLSHMRYVGEREARQALTDQNRDLLRRLQSVNVPPKRTIYVQIHDAGSSSPVVLNDLRDRDQLQQRGCHLMDSHDVAGIAKLTEQLGEGAIVYVDDFVASGSQLLSARKGVIEYVMGNFSEFALAICICEEASHRLSREGVEPRASISHTRAERPLHELCSTLLPETKQRLIALCEGIDRKGALGFQQMATMVVLYRNAPNTTPRVFRGSNRQDPTRGLFPRTTDLPITVV